MRARVFYLTVAVLVACDQVSKAVVMRYIPEQGRPILEPFLSLTPARNSGSAFGLLQAHNAVFVAVAIVAIGALVYAYHSMQRGDPLLLMSLALALGGAIGNLIDRAQFGYVRDFFHIHDVAGQTLWPIFNIADSAITVAICLLILRILRPPRSIKNTTLPDPDGADPA
jgi:signal peptidase II